MHELTEVSSYTRRMLVLRHPLVLLLLTALILAGVQRSFQAPTPVAADVPHSEFSAMRALDLLQGLLAENVPHVAGSNANHRIADRIRGHLERWGYEVQEQAQVACNARFGSCSPVRNLLAIRPGHEGKRAVMLTAHYDSVPAGPGAADDGAGVAAVLEIARMSALADPVQNDLVFLFTDAEELGLIGAELFAESHPVFDKVATVINLEARGVTGPSTMFETGDGNRSIIRVYSKNVTRPMANSLTYEIYKRLPNDTDYSVYRERGVMGLNFGFVGGVAGYHSAIDDIARLDPGSLQHHGDNAWALLQALGDRELLKISSKENAGYIDLFSWRLIHYPIAVTAGLALVLSVGVLIVIGIAYRRHFRFRQLRWGILYLPLLFLVIVAGGLLLSWPLGHWLDAHPLEHPFPWPGRLALFAWVILSVYWVTRVVLEKVSPCAWMFLIWGLVSALALYLSSQVPEAAHIALIPLLAFALGSLIDLVRPRSSAPLLASSLLGFAGAVYISLYHFFLADALASFDGLHIKAVPLCLAAGTAMPLLLAWYGEREMSLRPIRIMGGIVLVLVLVQILSPGFTQDRPRPMGLSYAEGDPADVGYLVLDDFLRHADEGFADEKGFEHIAIDVSLVPGRSYRVLEIAAQDLPGLTLASIEVNQGDESVSRTMTLQVPQGAQALTLLLSKESGLKRAWVNGLLALDRSLETRHEQKNQVRISYPAPGNLELVLESETGRAVELRSELRSEMPEGLASAHSESWPDNAQPVHVGPAARKIQIFELPEAGPAERPQP